MIQLQPACACVLLLPRYQCEMSEFSRCNQLCLCRLLKPNRFLLILLPASKSHSIPAALFSKPSFGVTAFTTACRADNTALPFITLLCAKCCVNPEQRNGFLPSPQSQPTDHVSSKPRWL